MRACIRVSGNASASWCLSLASSQEIYLGLTRARMAIQAPCIHVPCCPCSKLTRVTPLSLKPQTCNSEDWLLTRRLMLFIELRLTQEMLMTPIQVLLRPTPIADCTHALDGNSGPSLGPYPCNAYDTILTSFFLSPQTLRKGWCLQECCNPTWQSSPTTKPAMSFF